MFSSWISIFFLFLYLPFNAGTVFVNFRFVILGKSIAIYVKKLSDDVLVVVVNCLYGRI